MSAALKNLTPYRRTLICLGAISVFWLSGLSGNLLHAQTPDARAVAFAVQQQLVKAIEKSEHSVVAISKIKTRKQQFQSRIPAPFGLDPNQDMNLSHNPQDLNFMPTEFGSGVIIPDPTPQNRVLVLTNYHLTQGGPVAGEKRIPENRIYVHTENRQGFYAAIIAADPRSDLAVLIPLGRLDGDYLRSLKPIQYGNAESVRKGQFVIALGNPYAIARDGSPSASWGIVSNFQRYPVPIFKNFLNQELAKKETIHHFGTLLQVDTHLDLGSSGGALLDLDGKLIGVTTSLAALEGYEKSAGYAIPLDPETRRIIQSLASGLEAEYGFLGITPNTVDRSEANRNVASIVNLKEPAYVQAGSVKQHSPAQQAGLLPSDLILSINGKELRNELDLMREVGKAGAGSEAKLQILRGKNPRELTLTVKLGKWPVADDEGIVQTRYRHPLWRGLRVDYPTARAKYTFSPFTYPPAVVVTHVAPDSPAQQAGLTEGTFIRLINDQPVQTPDAFYQEAQRASTSPVTLQLLDDRKIILPTSKQ
ncbi:trypsin-like peptidase domain-containing protein [Gimesia panareensis]|uniref:trypsin-like peptidase domain-containing protein n=1 Tax=Gimesia panareensis TaxID=2527978 RepID=UPI00118BB606|nr:trypsin-like peptidase domain-containing protein [Gimesia panareensis]QDU48919.1 putative periplasmic serine endoprotease DegP-like precursor [Gimesia panareensis]